MTDPPVEAAGAVVWRSVRERLEVLLVHRGRYDDWTFPKGKLDPGEPAAVAAVREVEEETGVRIRLGPRLARHQYQMTRSPGAKQVTYWCGRPLSSAAGRAVEAYQPNAEIDGVGWLDVTTATQRLTYPRDVAVLDTLTEMAGADLHRSSPLVVLRHAEAEPRKTWVGADVARPLAPEGLRQAGLVVPLMSAFDVRRALSSDADRCRQTVQPYVDDRATRKVRLDLTAALSEEHATKRRVRDSVAPLLVTKKRVVVCSHRPVLPWVFEALGLEEVGLAPGQLVVVHRRGGRVVSSDLVSS